MDAPDGAETRALEAKIRKLGRVIRALLAEEPAKTQAALQANGIQDLQAFLSPDYVLEDEEEENLKEATWDADDGVYRCPECYWEIEAGECSKCDLEFYTPEDIQLEDEAEYTDEVANPDRLSQPARGSTPLLDDERYEYPPEYISSESRRAEYEQLRRRGASRLMCLTFNLEYDSDVGIIAWADGEIYDAFSGPLMQQGDFWKFLLGRRIELDEDDPDGSGFIEGLLEGALPDSQWETVEESPGIWVTKAVDYGSESSSDEDESMSQSEAAGTTPKTYPGTLSWIQGQTPEEQDALLEPDYVPPAHPVQACSYEASDEDEDELDDDMSVDEWDPTMPDRAWGESEDDEQEEATESELEIKVEDALMALSVSDDDSADSDFDEEDQFSGDEIVLGLQA